MILTAAALRQRFVAFVAERSRPGRRDAGPPAAAIPERTGWDAYAAFYDWENARTFGRRDVAFWRRLVEQESAPALELGCGTGRLLLPLGRLGTPMVGIDRSTPMLARARARVRRLRPRDRPALVHGDVTSLPLAASSFGLVMAPYGMLQSLLDDADLDRTLMEIARVLRRGGLAGIDLVPDLPAWSEYHRRVRLRGRSTRGGQVTLIETVRQDRERGLTVFDEEFVERRGRREDRRRFSLTFRTLAVGEIVARLARVGLAAEAVLGDYRGGALDARSDVWLILARKK